MIYIIRFLEMLTAGAVPSALSAYAIVRQPVVALWVTLCVLSFIIFIALNIYFSIILYRAVKKDKKAYIKISLTACIAYIAFSIIIYKFTDPMLFSFLCANLRAFEKIVIKTKYTMIVSHIISVFFVFIVPHFVDRHDVKVAAKNKELEEILSSDTELLIDLDDDTLPDDPYMDEDDI